MKYRIRQTNEFYIVQKRILFWFDAPEWYYDIYNHYLKGVIFYSSEWEARKAIQRMKAGPTRYRGHKIVEIFNGKFLDLTSSEWVFFRHVRYSPDITSLSQMKNKIDKQIAYNKRFKTVKYIEE